MRIRSVSHIAPRAERRERNFAESLQALNGIERHRGAGRNVSPTQHQLTIGAQPAVTISKGLLALRLSIKTESIDPIADDQVEVPLGKKLVQPFQRCDDMLPTTVSASLRHRLDGPELLPSKVAAL